MLKIVVFDSRGRVEIFGNVNIVSLDSDIFFQSCSKCSHTTTRSVVPTVPPRFSLHHWTPACVIWARCRSTRQPMPVPTSTTNITCSSSSATTCIIFLWHWERLRIRGREGGDESKSCEEGFGALVEDEWVMQRRDRSEEEYLRLWRGWGSERWVAQGIHSFAVILVPFLRLTLQMSCGNPSYKSQLKLTTKPVAVPSPSKLSLKTITTRPSSAKLSLTIMLDKLLWDSQKYSTNTFCFAKSLTQPSCHFELAAFMSHITLLIMSSKRILTFKHFHQEL